MAKLTKKEQEIWDKPYGLLTDKEWDILIKLYDRIGVVKGIEDVDLEQVNQEQQTKSNKKGRK